MLEKWTERIENMKKRYSALKARYRALKIRYRALKTRVQKFGERIAPYVRAELLIPIFLVLLVMYGLISENMGWM